MDRHRAGAWSALVLVALAAAGCSDGQGERAPVDLPDEVLGLTADDALAERVRTDLRDVLPDGAAAAAAVYVASSGQPVYVLHVAAARLDDPVGTASDVLDGWASDDRRTLTGPAVTPPGRPGAGTCSAATSAGQDAVVCVAAEQDRLVVVVDFRLVTTEVAATDLVSVLDVLDP